MKNRRNISEEVFEPLSMTPIPLSQVCATIQPDIVLVSEALTRTIPDSLNVLKRW